MTGVWARAGGDSSTFLGDKKVDLSPPAGASAGRRWLLHLSSQTNGGQLTASRVDGSVR